ncbi:MAG: DUF2312 domain-containing protein [Aestuariivita sp.]|nr:DUF2312 domain-containing protein [Aestuariivita sp.]
MIDKEINSVNRATAQELRQLVEKYERLEVERSDVLAQQREVMAEAKSKGYDTRVLRKLIVLRKRDSEKVAEEEAILELYKNTLGMSSEV